SSGSITRKFGPSWKQSTGHTSTQSVYLHLMQFSVTTKGMLGLWFDGRAHFSGSRRRGGRRALAAVAQAAPQGQSAVPGAGKSPRIAARASSFGWRRMYGAPYGIR